MRRADVDGGSPMTASVDEMMAFLDASVSPYHAVAEAAAVLDAAGFTALDPLDPWDGRDADGPAYVARGGSIVAWVPGSERDAGAPMRLIGAHTDSPGLRIRPRPDRSLAGFRQLAVEVYGGALRNSWLDRDLGLAGRVALQGLHGDVEHRLVRTGSAVMRVPQLAIHLDREISSTGLNLNPQQHLTPVWGLGDSHDGEFRAWLAEQVDAPVDAVTAWEIMAFDVQPPAFIGPDAELLAAGRLDDLACCWAALGAIVAAAGRSGVQQNTSVVVLNDHEEVGSATATGADGAWLEHVLERRAVALGGTRSDLLRSLAASMLLSADMAHATHPNYPERHEPG
ncbi:MAG: M18 family aminopeptidase, partial [Actinobacteria bacterium]|nr:M18 family aminopeptidase [Actinomycetota bacterium]